MVDKTKPLFMISMVSEMLQVHPQTLRLYEREGLISPSRGKRARLYSQEDIERIGLILRLTRELGVNRAGVDIILRMRDRIEMLEHEMDDMMQHLDRHLKREFERRLKRFFEEE